MKLIFVFTFCIVTAFAGPVPEYQPENKSESGHQLHHFAVNEFGSEAVTLLKESVNVAVKFLDKHLPIHVAGSTEPTTESTANHVNALNSAGQTPIYTAVLDGHLEIVNLLLEMGANPNIQVPQTGRTPIHAAVETGLENIVISLIEHHADINIRDKNGDSPLDVVLKNGYKTIARVLIQKGANIDEYRKPSKLPILGCIAHKSNTALTTTLLDRSIDSEKGWENSLTEAVKRGDVKTTQLLIINCEINVRDIKKPWPLHMAAKAGNVDVMDVLLVNGAHINTQDDYGNTPLHWAAYSGAFAAKYLIDHGAEINSKNKNGYTPLHLAAHEDKANFVRILLENGSDINVKSNKENTPLHWAAYYGYEDVVRILLEYGADVKIQNIDGITARKFAETKVRTSIVKLIKEAEDIQNDNS